MAGISVLLGLPKAPCRNPVSLLMVDFPPGTAETVAGSFSQFLSPQFSLLARFSHWCTHRSCSLDTVCSSSSGFV